MRWNGNGELVTGNDNILFYIGIENGSESGVGLIISKEIRNSLQTWKSIADRVIMARFESKLRHVTIIQCYAPTEDAEDTKKDEFYAQVTSKGHIIILMADFNGIIG